MSEANKQNFEFDSVYIGRQGPKDSFTGNIIEETAGYKQKSLKTNSRLPNKTVKSRKGDFNAIEPIKKLWKEDFRAKPTNY